VVVSVIRCATWPAARTSLVRVRPRMVTTDPSTSAAAARTSTGVLCRCPIPTAAAVCAGKNAVGVILTGMGKDGARGMLELKNAGAYNFAQDEASCVVFGMPREAIAVGATHEVGALNDLPSMVLDYLAAQGSRALRV